MTKELNELKVVGVDVDNTINNFSELFIVYLERLTGFKLKEEDIFDWNLGHVINTMSEGKVNGDISKQIIIMEDFISELEILDNVKEVLERVLKDKKIKVKLVTALADEKLIPVRDNWLKLKLQDMDIEIVYEVNKEKVKMDYFIDDAIHNLDSLAPILGKENCICIKHKYNENCNYLKVNNIEEAFEYIYKKENF